MSGNLKVVDTCGLCLAVALTGGTVEDDVLRDIDGATSSAGVGRGVGTSVCFLRCQKRGRPS